MLFGERTEEIMPFWALLTSCIFLLSTFYYVYGLVTFNLCVWWNGRQS